MCAEAVHQGKLYITLSGLLKYYFKKCFTIFNFDEGFGTDPAVLGNLCRNSPIDAPAAGNNSGSIP